MKKLTDKEIEEILEKELKKTENLMDKGKVIRKIQGFYFCYTKYAFTTL